MVFDDGVTACLGDDHFHMTTTTGGAARVLGWLEEYHQTEWPDLEVYMSSVTEQWAVASICGPRAPELAAGLFDDIDADPERFPLHEPRIRPYRRGAGPGVSHLLLPARSATRSMCRQVTGSGSGAP